MKKISFLKFVAEPVRFYYEIKKIYKSNAGLMPVHYLRRSEARAPSLVSRVVIFNLINA